MSCTGCATPSVGSRVPSGAAGAPPTLDPAVLRRVDPVLRGFAYRAVRRWDLVEDLVQETYLAAWQGRSSFEGRSSIRTWMVGILTRKIVDHYRRHGREVLTERLPEPALTTSGPPPEHRVDARRARLVVERHLGALPELERLAVLMCDVENLDRPEAARVLNVTRGHLRVLLHRGRHRLRQVLEAADLRPA